MLYQGIEIVVSGKVNFIVLVRLRYTFVMHWSLIHGLHMGYAIVCNKKATIQILREFRIKYASKTSVKGQNN